MLDEAIRRARDGVSRMKFGRDGKPLIDPRTSEPYVEHEYSDMLLVKLLAARMPETYGEKRAVKLEHSGHLTLDEFRARLAEAKARGD